MESSDLNNGPALIKASTRELDEGAPRDDEQSAEKNRAPVSGLAVAGFVLAIVGFLVPYASLVAIVLSAVALKTTSRPAVSGRALAGWGLGLGIISCAVGAILGVIANQEAQKTLQDETVSVSETVSEATPVGPIPVDGSYTCDRNAAVSDENQFAVTLRDGRVEEAWKGVFMPSSVPDGYYDSTFNQMMGPPGETVWTAVPWGKLDILSETSIEVQFPTANAVKTCSLDGMRVVG